MHFSAKIWSFFLENYGKGKGEWNGKAELYYASGFRVKGHVLACKHFNAAEKMIHTVHMNKGYWSVFTLNKIWYLPEFQTVVFQIPEIQRDCVYLLCVFVSNEIPLGFFAPFTGGSVRVAGRVLPCYKR